MVTLNRIYTRQGDKGETQLVGGKKVRKDSLRLEAYGTIDELMSVIGVAIEELSDHSPDGIKGLITSLRQIQNKLFDLGSILATEPTKLKERDRALIGKRDVESLERVIDRMNTGLPTLKSFVLPGGSKGAALLHLGRTVCRRAERVVVALGNKEEVPEFLLVFLNRLSDYLFVASRDVNRTLGREEVLWEIGKEKFLEES